MTARKPHVHILDAGEEDWGAHCDRADARRAARQDLKDLNSFTDISMTQDVLIIVNSDECCAQDHDPCYYDRNITLLAAMRQPPLWTHNFPIQTSAIYPQGGKRIPRWKMPCSMTIDQAMALWPFTGHPEAMPIWRYDNMLADSALCPCSTRSHRRKNCTIGPGGLKCSICGTLH